MKHLKVLVAYDDSAASAKALTFARELARTHDAELHVIAAVQVPDIAEDAEIRQIVERARRHYARRVQGAAHVGPGPHAPAPHLEVAVGFPADQIVLYAERHHVGHIVVSQDRRARGQDWLFSVARQVVISAPCTVTVVRA
jgi:nucleotide-binding universal stress UspA family protein